jgi:hypothetical protein
MGDWGRFGELGVDVGLGSLHIAKRKGDWESSRGGMMYLKGML